MAQKGVVFTTSLSLKQCTDVFRRGAESARGLNARFTEAIAKVKGNGDMTGFYTPSFDSPFASVDGVPDFAVGINILGPMHGANGPGIPVHMYVDEQQKHRSVQLVSRHGLTGGPRSARLTRKFLDEFRAADPHLRVDEGNI
jgi:hypothetical protein